MVAYVNAPNIRCLSGDLLINEYLLQKITNDTPAYAILAIKKLVQYDLPIGACNPVPSQSMLFDLLDEWHFHEHGADAL